MKKIKLKKILIVVLWIIGLSGLITSLAFVSKQEKNVIAENLFVTVNNTEVNTFIDEEEIKEFFIERKDSILNTSIKNINTTNLEKTLNSHPAIESSDISVDVNGDVTIVAKQRTPLVRVINQDGESYYIDTQSKLMPLNDKFTARVIVATGIINEPYAQRYQYSVNSISTNENFSKTSVLDDIYNMSTYIASDSVLSSLIHQINVTTEVEIELYPSIGNHIIVFGKAENIEEKFKKLKLFYTEGLNKTDGWNKYAIVNLKYKNQVVCTK